MTTTQLPGVAELLERFRTFRYSCFRLETRQTYAGSGEDEQLTAFLRGDPYSADTDEREWAAMLRANREAGKTQQRVHVIREPLTDYLRYELTWEYGPHAAAGEDIRLIDATHRWPDDVPDQPDFWLFDSCELFFLDYDPDSGWQGAGHSTEPVVIADACLVRDAALHQSTPWDDYIRERPQLAARLPKGA